MVKLGFRESGILEKRDLGKVEFEKAEIGILGKRDFVRAGLWESAILKKLEKWNFGKVVF